MNLAMWEIVLILAMLGNLVWDMSGRHVLRSPWPLFITVLISAPLVVKLATKIF